MENATKMNTNNTNDAIADVKKSSVKQVI